MKTINPEFTSYNNINNEGKEGFNPHDKYLASVTSEPLSSILETKQYRLKRIMNGTATESARYEELRKEIAELDAAIEIAEKEGN